MAKDKKESRKRKKKKKLKKKLQAFRGVARRYGHQRDDDDEADSD